MNKDINSEDSGFYIKITLFLLACSIFFAYGRVAPLLWMTWTSGDYSHGIFVPFVSLYMIWIERNKLSAIKAMPDIWFGFPIILFSAFILAAGMIGSIIALQIYSLLILIPGLILLLLGREYFRALLLPLAYLLLMVPFLDPLLDYIHWPLQVSTAIIVSLFLNILRIPVYRSSQYIQLPDATLEVAEECSGLQFLMAMVTIGIPLAYLTQRHRWQKIVLIISSVVIGLMSNWLRVIFIALWTYYTGTFSHGFIHIFKGMLIAAIGFAFLFLEASMLSRISSAEPDLEKYETSPIRANYYNGFKTVWVAIALLVSLGTYLLLYKPIPVPLKTLKVESLISKIGAWEGNATGNMEKIFVLPGVDAEISMLFEDKTGHDLNVYVGYFESQSQGKELVDDELKQLNRNVNQIEIDVADHGKVIINNKIINRGSEKYILSFWYNINGRIVTDKYRVKFYTILDGLLFQKTNGALVMVFSPIGNSENIYDVDSIQKNFLHQFIPLVNAHI